MDEKTTEIVTVIEIEIEIDEEVLQMGGHTRAYPQAREQTGERNLQRDLEVHLLRLRFPLRQCHRLLCPPTVPVGR